MSHWQQIEGIWSQVKRQRVFGIALLAVIGLYVGLYAALGQGIWSRSHWDSYTLQALAWWQGRVTLEQNYSYLELAEVNGQVFVSFPPFPSLIWFVLVPLVGAATPNNLVNTLFAIASFSLAFWLMRFKGYGDREALLWSVFLVFGSNILYMSTNGGVWFQAQVLSFLLTLVMIACLEQRSAWAWHLGMAALACAVGCRPLQIVFFGYAFLRLGQHLHRDSLSQTLRRMLPYLIAPIAIGSLYALYNVVRFGNPLEFGHNYLPEFETIPQFGWHYVWPNLRGVLRLPRWQAGRLVLPLFEGFAFYLANPLFLAFAIRWLWRRVMRQRWLVWDGVIPALVLLHMLLTLMHKGMGGWQFGSRYLVDSLPLLFAYILHTGGRYSRVDSLMAIGALAFNVYGTLWLFLEWA